MHSRIVVLIAIAAYAQRPAASHAAGLQIGRSWADCVVALTHDGDSDGIEDDCELALATAFQPELVFASVDSAEDKSRAPFFAVRQWNYRWVRIFYALSYYHDRGDPDMDGLAAHDGDSEVIVIDASNAYGGVWQLESVFLSAHHHQLGSHSSGTYSPTAFEYADALAGYPYADSQSRGRPIVWVAEHKHANYPDAATCDRGGFLGSDACSDDQREPLFPLPLVGRNLGHSGEGQQVTDFFINMGAWEWYWSPLLALPPFLQDL